MTAASALTVPQDESKFLTAPVIALSRNAWFAKNAALSLI